MVQTDYLIIAVISIMFLLLCLFHLHENDIFSKQEIDRFKILILFTVFQIVIDTTFEYLVGKTVVPTIVLYILKIIEFSANPVFALLVLNIFMTKKENSKRKRIEKVHKVLRIIAISNVIIQIIALKGKLFFYIDENNLYNRGSFIFMYLIILVVSISLLLYGIIIYSNKTQSLMKDSLFAFFFILFAGLGFKSLFYGKNYDWLCLSVSILFLLIYYSNITLRIDPLTQLFNRQVYTRLIEKIDYTTLIIMIDANNYKLINDTYGHECGDQTLKLLARLVLKAYSKYGYCFRLGGDEFCVILKPNVFEKLIQETSHYDAYALAQTLMDKLDALILAHSDSKNGEDDYLKYGVSQGYGIYYSPNKYPSIRENLPIEQVLKLADKRMYQAKEEFKKKNKSTSPEFIEDSGLE